MTETILNVNLLQKEVISLEKYLETRKLTFREVDLVLQETISLRNMIKQSSEKEAFEIARRVTKKIEEMEEQKKKDK